MNASPDNVADAIRGGERFRITVSRQTADNWHHLWTATIYDLADHGVEIPYAVVSSDDLLDAMTQAAHYIYVAGTDSSERGPQLTVNDLSWLLPS